MTSQGSGVEASASWVVVQFEFSPLDRSTSDLPLYAKSSLVRIAHRSDVMTRQPKFRGLLKGSTQTVCAVGAIMVYDPDLVDQQYPYQVNVAAAADHRTVDSSAPRDVMLILRPSLV